MPCMAGNCEIPSGHKKRNSPFPYAWAFRSEGVTWIGFSLCDVTPTPNSPISACYWER